MHRGQIWLYSADPTVGDEIGLITRLRKTTAESSAIASTIYLLKGLQYAIA